MSRRGRLSGRERRELRRRARHRLKWTLRNLAIFGAAVAIPVVIGVGLILFVFADAGDGDRETSVLASPTATAEDSGPPPVPGEPTYSDTGLGIVDIETGTGETPVSGQTLVVHYTGWLSEGGMKFDSSLDRGTPFEFLLGAGGVIDGWEEGLATMKVGGTRRLIVPAELAYGEQGRPPTIPPNAELTFDVELLEIKGGP